jgi:predicted metalloprotease with PDZ domain
VPYTFEDVVAGMNEVAPYDWRGFFTERLRSHGPGAPLGGLENAGWKIVFTDIPNEHGRAGEIVNQVASFGFSLGFDVHAPGGDQSDRILDVIPGSPADLAGVAPGMHLLGVNGRKWTPEILHGAIALAKNSKEPIELLVENADYFKICRVDYHGGERYPHLEAIAGKSDVLGEIARMKAAPVSVSKTY